MLINLSPPHTGDERVIMTILKEQLANHPDDRVLVCAPTNSAVDMLCRQALDLFPASESQHLVVRVGDEERIDSTVHSVTLNALAGGDPDSLSKIELQVKIGAAMDSFKKSKISHFELNQVVESLGDAVEGIRRDRTAAEERRRDALDRAKFVFVTLGSSGSDQLHDTRMFGLVIVARANSANEAATLIPLRRAGRAVLFGDEPQIPPRVSEAGQWLGYHRSLFERLLTRGHASILLDQQNHCHPSVYVQPSEVMYNGEVTNTNDDSILQLFGWQVLGYWYPSTFINVSGQECRSGTSWENTEEVAAAVHVLKRIFTSSATDRGAIEGGFSIALLSPYSAQVTALYAAVQHLAMPEHIRLQ